MTMGHYFLRAFLVDRRTHFNPKNDGKGRLRQEISSCFSSKRLVFGYTHSLWIEPEPIAFDVEKCAHRSAYSKGGS